MGTRSTIRILVVDDSALIRQMLTRALAMDPRLEVIGTARTGVEAIEKARELVPDVVTLDIEMPELSGLEALPHIVKLTPARVIMLSSVDDPDTTYQALATGAVDFIAKPKGGFATSLSELTDLLMKKIKTAYRIEPSKRTTVVVPAIDTVIRSRLQDRLGEQRQIRDRRRTDLRTAVVIASSTGGPPALESVLGGLQDDLPAAFFVVQHLPAGFTESLTRRLARATELEVVLAEDNMGIEAGKVYVAPHGLHMTLESRRTGRPRIRAEGGSPIHGVMPAADPLFLSAAKAFRENTVGVVLTGMGADGADGLAAVRAMSGRTIVQDEETSVVWGMPGAAVRKGAACVVVPLPRVAAEIGRAVREGGA